MAVPVFTYCPGRMVDHPNLRQPNPVTLYYDALFCKSNYPQTACSCPVNFSDLCQCRSADACEDELLAVAFRARGKFGETPAECRSLMSCIIFGRYHSSFIPQVWVTISISIVATTHTLAVFFSAAENFTIVGQTFYRVM